MLIHYKNFRLRRKIDTIFPSEITFVHQKFRLRRKIVIIFPL